jgi:hypothetical protein
MKSQSMYGLALMTVVVASLEACGGGSYGGGGGGMYSSSSSSSSSSALTADLNSIQAHIFTPICSPCHSGAGAPFGLQLDAGHAYANLVGVPSGEQPSVLRVNPGNPNQSYLIQKLEGSPGITGQRMPFGGPYLDQPTIDVIAQWITNGAPNAAAAQVSQRNTATQMRTEALVLTTTSPPADAVMQAPVANLLVGFNHSMDATLLNAGTVQLRVLQADGGLTAGALIPAYFSLPVGDSAAVLITPQRPLGAGTYQVTVSGGGNGTLGLADIGGQVLGHDETFVFTVESTK